MSRLAKYHDFLVRKEAELDRIKQEHQESIKKLSGAAETIDERIRAREVINDVLVITQEQVRQFVERVVSLALSSVYGQNYGFELEFDIKRNQSEITPWLVKDGDRFSLKDEVGGGVCDVCSFALRLVLWSLSSPRTSPVFILDEPGRFLSRDKQPLFGEMIQQVSSMLGLQIIMVSHSPDLIDTADRAYEVKQQNGISEVQLIKES